MARSGRWLLSIDTENQSLWQTQSELAGCLSSSPIQVMDIGKREWETGVWPSF